jgi:hypothetical protein
MQIPVIGWLVDKITAALTAFDDALARGNDELSDE